MDALVASSLAGKYSAPILLSNGTGVPAGDAVKDKAIKSSPSAYCCVSDTVLNSITPAPIKEITSVKGVAGKQYDINKGNQYLAFTVNGGRTITLEKLDELGYEIEFVATEDVFGASDYSSADGNLDDARMTDLYDNSDVRTVKYTVTIFKDGEEVCTSDSVSFKLVDGEVTAASSITSYVLYLESGDTNGYQKGEDVTLNSSTLVVGDDAYIGKVKATTIEGYTNQDVTASVTLETSDPFVVEVGDDLALIPLAAGTATITITSGSASKDITVKVSEAERKASSATLNVSSLKVSKASVAGQDAVVILKDQYGDPFVGQNGVDFTATANEINNSEGTKIAAVEENPGPPIRPATAIIKASSLSS